MGDRIPLPQEPIAEMDAVVQYDRGARCYIMPEYKYFVRKILSRGIRSGRVLDIGTGSGRLAIELAKAKNCHFDIVGLDISENMIRLAKDNARVNGIADRITFQVGTAATIPFADSSFDLTISYASLHHWFQPVQVFNEIGRVTKDTGHILVRDNIRVYDNPAGHAAIWLVSRFMNKRHRENWPKALLASYKIPEVERILQQSRLKNYRVSSDFFLIDLCVESPSLPKR